MAATKRQTRTATVAANRHDADVLRDECNALIGELGRRNMRVEMGILRTTAESFAVCKLLIDKGICTEAELQAEVYGAMRSLLANLLQQVEEQQLTAQRSRVQPVRAPGLVVARR
jgi:hypothetical protein